MSKSSRLYLFHGSDTRSSLDALHRWERVFLEKYSVVSRYVIDADELNLDGVRREVARQAQSISLFPDPILLVIKRLGSHEKTKAIGATMRTILNDIQSSCGDDVTVVLWEDKLLGESSGIRAWFSEQEEARLAKATVYLVPAAHNVAEVVQRYVKAVERTIDKDALSWFTDQYRQREKALRLLEKLRSTEVLARDDRAWWMYNTLDQAVVLSEQNITKEVIRACAEHVESVSVFEIVNALKEERWSEVRKLFVHWARGQEEGAYYGFWSLLRIQFRKLAEVRHSREYAQYGLRLLAELEIISKNSQIPSEILTEMLFIRLRRFEGVQLSIIEPRTLWLSTLPLS